MNMLAEKRYTFTNYYEIIIFITITLDEILNCSKEPISVLEKKQIILQLTDCLQTVILRKPVEENI